MDQMKASRIQRLKRESALCRAAFAAKFEETHDVERPIESDGRSGLPQENVADIGVEIAIVRRGRGNAAMGERVA